MRNCGRRLLVTDRNVWFASDLGIIDLGLREIDCAIWDNGLEIDVG